MNKPSFSLFTWVWFGQVISLLGSGLTSFALGVWVYQTTGQVTNFALVALCTVIPTLVLSPLSGALVDRWNYRVVMLLSDLASGLTTLAVALLFYSNRLQLWHIFLLVAANACFTTFQQPAYAALTSLLVPKPQLGRAGGMLQAGMAAADLLAPLTAGVLMAQIGLTGVFLLDFGSFLFAAGVLLLAKIPGREIPAGDLKPSWHIRQLLGETRSGWLYIAARPGLLGLLVFFAIGNFAGGMISTLLVPMLLTFVTPATLGMVISIAGSGMLTGSLVMSAWGGPRRKITGVLAFEALKGLGIMLIGLRPEVWLAAFGAAFAHFTMPFAAACNQAIWQAKVPQEMQGRVFALRQMVAKSIMPLAYLLVGPLADRVFEPGMRSPQGIWSALGSLTGTGAGRGMGVLFSLMGLVILLAALAGALSPAIRSVERLDISETAGASVTSQGGMHPHPLESNRVE